MSLWFPSARTLHPPWRLGLKVSLSRFLCPLASGIFLRLSLQSKNALMSMKLKWPVKESYTAASVTFVVSRVPPAVLSSRKTFNANSNSSSGQGDADPTWLRTRWPQLEGPFRYISGLGPAGPVVPLRFQQGSLFSKFRKRLANSPLLDRCLAPAQKPTLWREKVFLPWRGLSPPPG